MDDPRKESRERLVQLTTTELIELFRSQRLSSTDVTVIDEILEFRGISKTARENLKNESGFSPAAPSAAIDTFSYKEFSDRPVLVTILALFAFLGFISDTYRFFVSETIGAKVYLLIFAVLNFFLAYGLWSLKKWARNYLVFVYSLNIFVAWTIIVSLYLFEDSSWKLSIWEIAHSVAYGNVKVTDALEAVRLKALFTASCIVTVVYGLLLAYFFRPDIRRLFQ